MIFDLTKVFLFQTNNKCNRNCIKYLNNSENDNNVYCVGDQKGELYFFEINQLQYKLISRKNFKKEITCISKIINSDKKFNRCLTTISDKIIGFENNGDEFFKMFNDSTEKLIYVKTEENLIYACSDFYLNCFEQKMGESMKNKLTFNSPGKINYLFVHSLNNINYQAILACEDNSIRVVFENQLSYCIETDFSVLCIEAFIDRKSKININKKDLTKNMLFGLSDGSILCYELFSEKYKFNFKIDFEKNLPCENIFSYHNIFGYENELILTINKKEVNVFIKSNEDSNYFTNITDLKFDETLIGLDKGVNFYNCNGIAVLTLSGKVYSIFNLEEFNNKKGLSNSLIDKQIEHMNKIIVKEEVKTKKINIELDRKSLNKDEKIEKLEEKLNFEINHSFEVINPPFLNIKIESFELIDSIYIKLDERIKFSRTNEFSFTTMGNNFYLLDVTMVKEFNIIFNIIDGEDIDLFFELIVIPNNINYYTKNLIVKIPYFYLNIKSDILEKNSKSCLKLEGSDLFNFFELKFKYFYNIKLLINEKDTIFYFKNLALENINEFHFKNENLVEIYSADLNFLIKLKEILIKQNKDKIKKFNISLEKESFLSLITNILGIIDDIWANYKNYKKWDYINDIIEKYPQDSQNLIEFNNIYKEQNNISEVYKLDQEIMEYIENILKKSLLNLVNYTNNKVLNEEDIEKLINLKDKSHILRELNKLNDN